MDKIAARNRAAQRTNQLPVVPATPEAAAPSGRFVVFEKWALISTSAVRKGLAMFNGSPKPTNAISTPPPSGSVAQTPNRARAPTTGTQDPIKVFLRVRPLKDGEEKAAGTCLDVQDESSVVIRSSKADETTYTFSRVYDSSSGQKMLYEQTAAPLVEAFLNGYSGVLLAYGNTNAGKTYTIQGTKHEPGLLPRILEDLFASLPHVAEKSAAPVPFKVDPSYRYGISVSYIEVYNEEVVDLLKPGQKQGQNPHDANTSSASDALAIMASGAKNRQVAMTQLNEDSSRSHSIFTIRLIRVPRDKDKDALKLDPTLIKTSKLSIVDLAGSERAKRAGNDGVRQNEANKINLSLLTFGRCLASLRWNQLHPNQPQQSVPFRESKLTRYLQEYFTVNGKAVMIVNVSPSSLSYGETNHVLQFASIAREVATTSKVDTGIAPRSAMKKRPEEETFEPTERAELLARVAQLELVLDAERTRLEQEIREEVLNDLSERLREMEASYEARNQQALAMMEEKYEKKIALINKVRDEAEEGKKGSKRAPCLSCSALQKKIELMQNFQDSFEVQKKEEIEHERHKTAAAAAEDRKQADANHKIELGALTAKLDAMQRDNELLKATLSKLAAEKGPVSPPAPAPVNRDKEKERKRRHAPNSPPAHSVAQAAKADKLVVAEKTAAAVLVSPKPLMSPTKADHSTNSPLDRSISHKDLRAFGGLNDTATFEDVPLDGGNRQTSKSQIGKNAPLGSFLWKKEKEEKIKDDDKKDKKEPKKSKKEEKKDEKKEAQKQDCLKRLGIQSPQGVKAAAKAPDHLTSLAKSDTRAMRMQLVRQVLKPGAKDASPAKKPTPNHMARMSDILHDKENSVISADDSDPGSPELVRGKRTRDESEVLPPSRRARTTRNTRARKARK